MASPPLFPAMVLPMRQAQRKPYLPHGPSLRACLSTPPLFPFSVLMWRAMLWELQDRESPSSSATNVPWSSPKLLGPASLEIFHLLNKQPRLDDFWGPFRVCICLYSACPVHILYLSLLLVVLQRTKSFQSATLPLHSTVFFFFSKNYVL